MTSSPPPYPPQPLDKFDPTPPWLPQEKPKVVTWFTAYAVFMAAVYAVCGAVGVLSLVASEQQIRSWEAEPADVRLQGGFLLVLGFIFMPAFGAAPLLPRRKWVWVYDLVLVAIGLTSMCCWPATIPILIYFVKPETRAWFENPGRGG